MISVYQDHNLDWFPRMRAMSLVSSDADGEQNEIRNLQEKLESTMKLVSNLSGQLTELKEQVGWTKMQHWQKHHGENMTSEWQVFLKTLDSRRCLRFVSLPFIAL